MQLLNKYIHWFVSLLYLWAVVLMGCLLHYYSQLSWELALKDSLISCLLVTMAIWGCLLAIKAYPTKVAIFGYGLLVAIVAGSATWHIDIWLLKWLIGDNAEYATWLEKSELVRRVIIYLVCGWSATVTALYKRIDTLEKLFRQQSDASVLLREAELFKLRQQLQPHFLYNSLNSISALIMIQPDKAQEMIGKLSDFLRSSVRREAQEKIRIADELTYIEAYLAIEAVRFGDRLQIQYQKDYTDDATIPPFLLQPILENAIKFGLYGKTGTVAIAMHIALQDAYLTITVTNPYDPHMQMPSGTGFGLEGIRRRLFLLYSRTDLLETQQENEIFTTILKIPQSHV